MCTMNFAGDSTHIILSPICPGDDGVPNEPDPEVSGWRRTVVTSGLLVTFTCLTLVIGKEYVKRAIGWLEDQDQWIVYLILVALFTAVSFPFTWGYILLTLACGYLFGLAKGLLVVATCALVGTLVAHIVIKTFMRRWVVNKVLQHEAISALMAVVGGPLAVKVVFFTRLTPVPLGLQNAVFAVSSMGVGQYMLASTFGLFPTQVINVYLGSTLRSMEDVLADDATKHMGYTVFTVQVFISIGLTLYVVKRAREVLRKAVETCDLQDGFQ